MGIRLPGGEPTLYPFGDDVGKLGEHAWYSDNRK